MNLSNIFNKFDMSWQATSYILTALLVFTLLYLLFYVSTKENEVTELKRLNTYYIDNIAFYRNEFLKLKNEQSKQEKIYE